MSKSQRPHAPLLRFLGGAGTVTGSRFLVDAPGARVLVDCGLFQGLKELRLRNWDPFPVDPASIDAVVLTHAHVDHCGYLPALWRAGFRGRVFATRGTLELCKVVLMDSARIQESDAAYANRVGYSKHEPALPLYEQDDARDVLDRFEDVPFHVATRIAPGIEATFHHAGHILGSSIISLAIERRGGGESRITFSGDLGRPDHPLLVAPEPPPEADVLLVESTYGDRMHEDETVIDRFTKAIVRTIGGGGVAVVPAFAVDRTEVVLRLVNQLVEAGRIPRTTIYVDSPMALAALDVYRRAITEGWTDIRPELQGEELPFDNGDLVEVRDVEASRALTRSDDPAIIISASGMATGGRVLHHLAARLPDERNSVILVGYQAAGTRGRHLLQGTRALKMLGRYVPVRAPVFDLTALSVHADRGELIDWARSAPRPPGVGFVVHGEPDSAESLRAAFAEELDWTAVVPRYLERVRLA